MNKTQLIDLIAESAEISKKQAAKALDATIDQIKVALAKGEDVTLIGFGTFATKQRPERKGRNPRTNEPMTIPAAVVPVFKPGKALKEEINTPNNIASSAATPQSATAA
jgi:DNA-binding protein HU-beta